MNYERLSFIEAIAQLAGALGMPIPQNGKPSAQTAGNSSLFELLAKAADYYQLQLRQHPESAQAVNYLKQRGVTGAIAKTFALGYAPDAWDGLLKAFPKQAAQLHDCGLLIKNDNGRYYDRFRGRIMFPIRNQRGQILGFGGRIIAQGEPKYLNSPETAVFHKGNELYGLYEAYQANKNLSQLIIVEGYMDVIALAQHGIHFAVATLGTATTAEHLKKLFRHTKKLIFCFDGDAAGYAAAWKALETALPFMEDGRQVRFLMLTDGHDPDSYIRSSEPGLFAKQMTSATLLEDFLFAKLSENVDLETPSGKAQFVKQIGERLALLPKGALKPLLLEQLAKLLRLNTHTVQHMLQNRPQRNQQPKFPPDPRQSAAATPRAPSLIRHALAILIQYPHLAKQLEPAPDLQAARSKGIALLNDLLLLIKTNPQLTTGALLEHWREHTYSKQLESLAAYPLNGPEPVLLLELKDTLARLSEEQKFEILWDKYQQGVLSPAEKNQLFQLLQAQKRSNDSQ